MNVHALSRAIVSATNPSPRFLAGFSVKPVGNPRLSISSNKVKLCTYRRKLSIRAGWDEGRPNSASVFIGGFVLGGLVAGVLGCIFAPQISRALAVPYRKELMRKLPKFIYDEEKALERTRRILTEKIEELNSAIDEVSAQLSAQSAAGGTAPDSDEAEASM